MARYMGLDVGDAHIGIAITDPLFITSQGLENYRRIGIEKDIAHLIDLIIQYDVTRIVVGMPYNLNAEIGTQANKTIDFVKKLQKKLKYSTRLNQAIDIVYEDERFTTAQATSLMRSFDMSSKKISKVIDKMSAQLILQAYIDKNCYLA